MTRTRTTVHAALLASLLLASALAGCASSDDVDSGSASSSSGGASSGAASSTSSSSSGGSSGASSSSSSSGGSSSGSTSSSSGSTLSHAKGSWALAASLPVPRSRLGVACVPDGRVFAIGGTEDGGVASTRVDVYDPADQAWSPGPSLPENLGTWIDVALGYDGKIYAFGLVSGKPSYVFDPAADEWTLLDATSNGNATYGAAVARGHSIVLLGGPNSGAPNVYDIDEDAFAEGVAYPPDPPQDTLVRSAPAGALGTDDTLWLMGGFDPRGGDIPAVSNVYTLAADATEWTEGPALPGPFAFAKAVTDASGRILVFGGQAGHYIGSNGVSVEILPDAYGFDGEDWFDLAPLGEARSEGGACVDPTGRVFFAGGRSPLPDGTITNVDTVEIFTP